MSARRPTRSRRLWWRLVVPAVGFALLTPLVGSGSAINSTLGQVDATVGVMFVLIGVTALLPWAVETIVRRAPDGPLPWLLAVRRLRREEGTTGRVIGAVGLAVAGAVALSVVFGAAEAHVRAERGTQGRNALSVNLRASTRAAGRRALAELERAPGVATSSAAQVTRVGRRFDVGVLVTLTGSDSEGGPVRDLAAALDPVAEVVQSAGSDPEQRLLGDLRRVLVGGALVVLAMIGASLLVAAGEGLRERRPALAVLAAVGTRRSTVAWSMLWQAAIPVAAGLAFAVALGVGLGAMLTAMVGVRLEYDWRDIAVMLAAGAGVIAAVTALTMPALGRAMRPEALRVE